MSSVRRNIGSKVRVHGINEAAREIVSAALDGLREAAEFGLEKSQEQVPVESSHLRDTGKVTMDPIKGVAAISYDGPYAVFQHEVMHLKHIHGGNAKFLELPVYDHREDFAEIMANRIRKVTEG